MWKFLNSATVVGGSLIAFLGFAVQQPEIQAVVQPQHAALAMAVATLGVVLARFRDGAGKSLTKGQAETLN